MAADVEDKELDDLDSEEEVRCPECGAVMDPDDTICPQCGAEFGYYCPVCDEEVPADATICPHCGAELDEDFEDEVGTPGQELERAVQRAEFCGNCGEPIGPGDEECPSCGVDLCPDCGNPLDPEDTVCPYCGAEFAFSCPECGEDVPPEAEVCPYCGFEFEEELDDD
jgi:predicted amidophosphoribosyltransferase